jgi:hypothetical protein
MAMQGILEDSAPPKHSLRVDWFQREPGGTTIFVKPAAADGAALQPVTQPDDDAAVLHG